jgi:hypothetical protein
LEILIMAQNDVQRLFNLTFSDLISFAKSFVVVLTRDLTDLSIFGLTAANVTTLSGLISDFEEMRTDIEYEGDLMVKTEAKDVLAEQVREQIRFMSVRAESCFGTNSVNYDLFRFNDINQLSDPELLTALQRITRTSNQYIAQLGAYGVTAALITELEDLATDFSAAMVAQEQSIDARRIATNERTTSANEIYTLVSNYSNYGKKLYVKSDPAKYNDYLIYTSTSPGTLTAPANYAFEPIFLNFTWDAVENATSYEIQSSTDGANYTQYWTGPYTDCNLSELPTTKMYYRVRARNANGYGPFSVVLSYDFTVPMVAPTNLAYDISTMNYTWNQVPAAQSYQLHWKHTEQETWTIVGAGSGNSYYQPYPSGNFLAKICALRYSEVGPFSEVLTFNVPVPG